MKPFATSCGMCCVLLASVLAGCELRPASPKQTALPGNSFSMTVQNLAASDEVEIFQLTIRFPGNACISIDSESYRSWIRSHTPNDPTPRDGQVILSGSRFIHPGDNKAYIQVFIHPQTKETGSSGTNYYPVPPDQKLEAYFHIVAADGIYKLDTPIEIAKIDGKPVTLTVGKPTPSTFDETTSK